MRQSKRQKLVAAGWKLGTAQEFVGLTDEEAAYVEVRVRLADSLRRRRRQRRLSQTAAARLLGSSQSRIAKMEAGDRSVSIDLLVRSLLSLGASRRDVGRTIASEQQLHRPGRTGARG